MKKAFVVLLVSLIVASCGRKLEKQLVGKWANDGGSSHVTEFFEDGTFNTSENKAGTWNVLEGSRVKLQYAEDSLILVLKDLRFSGNKLTFVFEQAGQSATLLRVE